MRIKVQPLLRPPGGTATLPGLPRRPARTAFNPGSGPSTTCAEGRARSVGRTSRSGCSDAYLYGGHSHREAIRLNSFYCWSIRPSTVWSAEGSLNPWLLMGRDYGPGPRVAGD